MASSPSKTPRASAAKSGKTSTRAKSASKTTAARKTPARKTATSKVTAAKTTAPKTTARRTKPKAKAARTALVVLGMHRSGTSAMTGVLARMGCDLPKTEMPANPSNAKGFYESQAAYALNNALMDSAGSTWQDWQPLSQSWAKSYRAEEFHDNITQVLADEFGTSRLFALKDPRICRLFPYWEKALVQVGCDISVLHIHRNPLEVAQSMAERKKLPLAAGLMLWLRYTLDAEAASRNHPRSFTSFARVMQNWQREIDRIEKDLGVVFPRRSLQTTAEIDAFLSPDLKHFNQASEDVTANSGISGWVRGVYDVLEKWAATGEDAAGRKKLDEVNAQFSMSAENFGPMVEHMQNEVPPGTVKKIAALKEQITAFEDEDSKRGDVVAELDALSKQLEEAHTAVKDSEAQQADLQAQQNTMQEGYAKAIKARKAVEAQHSEAAQALETLQAEHAQLAQQAHAKAEELAELQTRFDTAAEQTAQVTQQRDARSQDLQELEAKHAQLAQQTHTKAKELAELQTRFDTAAEQITQVTQQRDARSQDLQTLEAKHKQAVLDHETLTTKYEAQKQDIAALEDAQEQALKAHDDLMDAQTEKTAQVTALEQALGVQATELHTYQTQHANFVREAQAKDDELARMVQLNASFAEQQDSAREAANAWRTLQTEQIAILKEDLADSRATELARRAEAHSDQTKIASLDKQLVVLKEENAALNAAAKDQADTLAITESTLRQRQLESEQAHETILALRAELENNNAPAEVVVALEKEIAQHLAANTTLEKVIEGRSKEVAQHLTEITTLKDRLGNSDHMIATLEKVIEDRSKEVAQYQAESDLLNGRLKDRYQETARLAELNQRLESNRSGDEAIQLKLSQNIKQQAQQIKAQELELKTTMDALHEAKVARDYFQHTLASLQASSSWRITGPLRRVIRLFRRSPKG